MIQQQTVNTVAGVVYPALKAGPACTAVFVVDKNNQPLMPTSPRRARLLLQSKRADVFRMNPFTIRVLDREGGDVQDIDLKIDPGSKTTGIALVVKGKIKGWLCVAAWELTHRGQQIVNALMSRRALRHNRRSRKTRYRPARFLNRAKPTGWLPPSLISRICNVEAFCKKTQRVVPLSGLTIEQVRFDMQLMQNPDISGVSYQQGTLQGYEVQEYLLLKWSHRCSYCKIKDVPLQVEHITPKSRGGTNRISNLCLACEKCNQKKANHPIEKFLKNKPDLLQTILCQAKSPLKDAAAVNSTRLAIVKMLQRFGLPITTASGGQTKFNRINQGYAKSHWLDAACVSQTGAKVDISNIHAITMVQAKGRGSRQMCKSNKYGFPKREPKSVKRLHGFQTGDRVRLNKTTGKHKGIYDGVVAIRATGMFDITFGSLKKSITASHSCFSMMSRFDGYIYSRQQVV